MWGGSSVDGVMLRHVMFREQNPPLIGSTHPGHKINRDGAVILKMSRERFG